MEIKLEPEEGSKCALFQAKSIFREARLHASSLYGPNGTVAIRIMARPMQLGDGNE